MLVRPGAPRHRSRLFAAVRQSAFKPIKLGASCIARFAAMRADLLVTAHFVGIVVGIVETLNSVT